MRNFFKNVKNKVCSAVNVVKSKISAFVTAVRTEVFRLAVRSNTMLAETRAENFVDSGIKILIAVVIGALLLAGLYALFGDTIMPTVTDKVEDMFNFKG